jgi:histidinol-phosphate/aromatic aminotransferase/cobyric acid decarboxylase-like protein
MRMVIDNSVLTEDALRDFLSKSKKNRVVITDYLMIEALKDDPLNKIFRLMKIVCKYPNQVVVLKSMRRLTALKGRRCGMTRRMIEPGQTKGFGAWCAGLDKAEAGDKEYRRQLVEAGNDAIEQMNRIIAAQSTYAKVIEDEAKRYTADELQILRTDQPEP